MRPGTRAQAQAQLMQQLMQQLLQPLLQKRPDRAHWPQRAPLQDQRLPAPPNAGQLSWIELQTSFSPWRRATANRPPGSLGL